MARSIPLIFLFPVLVVPVLSAQSAPTPVARPAAASVAPGADATATPDSAASKRSARVISPEVAAQLAASRPKFTPVAPPLPPKPEEDLPDMRETDKPKNTIVRLPKFIVQERRPAVFREKDIHTKDGLADLAMRRYMTETDRALNRFRLPLFSAFSTNGSGGSNEDRAMAMYYEDERLKNMAEVADNTNMVQKSDAAAGAKMKSIERETFMRWSDIGWQGGKK